MGQGFPQGLSNQIVYNQLPMLNMLPSSSSAPGGGLDATALTLQSLQGGDAEALYGNLGLQIIPTQYVLDGDAASMAAGAAGLNLNGLNLVTIGGQQMLVPAMYLNQLGQLGGEQLQYVTTAGDGSAGGDVLPPIMPLFVSPFTTDSNQQVRAGARLANPGLLWAPQSQHQLPWAPQAAHIPPRCSTCRARTRPPRPGRSYRPRPRTPPDVPLPPPRPCCPPAAAEHALVAARPHVGHAAAGQSQRRPGHPPLLRGP
jgi:hypothetical protein